MKIWITGASGQLGSCLKLVQPEGLDVLYTSRSAVDLSKIDSIRSYIQNQGITHIVNTAAYTAVDKAEDEPEQAHFGNATLVGNLAKVAKEEGVLVVHISTDFVYGGSSNGLRTEQEVPAPTGVYGATKWKGEQVLAQSGADYLIVRTSWLYSACGGNFFLTMKRLLGEGKDLKVVADQIGAPTSALDLARFLWFMLKDDNRMKDFMNSTLNFSNEGVASWYDFAWTIGRDFQLPGSVKPCTTEDYPTKAARPAFSKMSLRRLRETGFENRHWREALGEFNE